jgi:hypothetical protein
LILLAACGRSTNVPAAQPIGEPAPGEFGQLKLHINGRNALDGKAVLTVRENIAVTGGFRFVKPYKGRAPFGSILILFTKPHKGGEALGQSGAATLKFSGNRSANFACNIERGVRRPGEYTLKVVGSNKQIVMQTKVRVTE